jgi:ketosteroid isomerase-like protein
MLDGKEAIAQWLKGTEVEIRRLEVTDLRIGGSKSVAYKTGNYETLYLSEGSSEVREAKGTHLWVLKKSPGGDWLVAIVTWTSRHGALQ